MGDLKVTMDYNLWQNFADKTSDKPTCIDLYL